MSHIDRYLVEEIEGLHISSGKRFYRGTLVGSPVDFHSVAVSSMEFSLAMSVHSLRQFLNHRLQNILPVVQDSE